MRVWIDTRSDGQWSGGPGSYPFTDANGLHSCPANFKVATRATPLSLIGFVGSSPESLSTAPGGSADQGLFEIGNTLLNYSPKTAGSIWLRINDRSNSGSDVGQQTVRIIVTTSHNRDRH
jgi:hypothetical protein